MNKVTTLEQLAAVHGVTVTTLRRWFADRRWKFARRGPWTVDQIARQWDWRERTLREDPATGKKLGKIQGVFTVAELARAKLIAQIKKAVAQEQALRLEMAIAHKDYIQRTHAQKQEAAKWRAVKEAFMHLPRSLRKSLTHATAAQAERILEKALRAIFVAFAHEPEGKRRVKVR